VGPFTEKEPLGDYVNRTVDRALDFNEIFQRVLPGLYKVMIEALWVHQGEKSRRSRFHLAFEEARFVRILKGPIPEEMIHMGKDNTSETRHLLPEQDPIFKTDFWKRHPFFFISDVIEKVFKAALVLRGVDDDSFFGE
jgi:hypothetical protein